MHSQLPAIDMTRIDVSLYDPKSKISKPRELSRVWVSLLVAKDEGRILAADHSVHPQSMETYRQLFQ